MDRDTHVEMRQEDKKGEEKWWRGWGGHIDGDTHIQTRRKGKNTERETDKTERQKQRERDSETPIIIETR